jgi:hypothetical protein
VTAEAEQLLCVFPPNFALLEFSEDLYIVPVICLSVLGSVGGGEKEVWLALAV